MEKTIGIELSVQDAQVILRDFAPLYTKLKNSSLLALKQEGFRDMNIEAKADLLAGICNKILRANPKD